VYGIFNEMPPPPESIFCDCPKIQKWDFEVSWQSSLSQLFRHICFLAHFTGGGIDSVLDLETGEFFTYLEEAVKLYDLELKAPKRVVLAA
jgi:hypothetical protein